MRMNKTWSTIHRHGNGRRAHACCFQPGGLSHDDVLKPGFWGRLGRRAGLGWPLISKEYATLSLALNGEGETGQR